MEPGLRARSHYPGLSTTQLLRSAVNLAAEITRFRDAETGLHLARVSQYASLARDHEESCGVRSRRRASEVASIRQRHGEGAPG